MLILFSGNTCNTKLIINNRFQRNLPSVHSCDSINPLISVDTKLAKTFDYFVLLKKEFMEQILWIMDNSIFHDLLYVNDFSLKSDINLFRVAHSSEVLCFLGNLFYSAILI